MGSQFFSGARAVRRLDVGVIVWIVVWVALGVLVWHDIAAQGQLAHRRDQGRHGGPGHRPGPGRGRRPAAGRRADRQLRRPHRAHGRRGGGQRAGQPRRDRPHGRDGRPRHRRAAGRPAAPLYLPVRLRWRRDVGAVAAALPGAAATRRSTSTWRAGPPTRSPGTSCAPSRPTRGAPSSAATAARWRTRSWRDCLGLRRPAGRHSVCARRAHAWTTPDIRGMPAYAAVRTHRDRRHRHRSGDARGRGALRAPRPGSLRGSASAADRYEIPSRLPTRETVGW